MAVAAALIALVILARAALQSRGPALLMAAIVLTPLGVLLTLSGTDAPRTRVNVAFIGYRIPLSKVTSCGAAARIGGRDGVWLGGDDVLTIPGYRSRLLQICSPGAPMSASSLTVRPVEPGLEWERGRGRPADGTHTQRVFLGALNDATASGTWAAGECLTTPAGRVSKSEVEAFAAEQWKSDDKGVPHALRTRILNWWRGTPAAGPGVYCVDVRSGRPARCGAAFTDPRNATFLWRASGRFRDSWNAIAPVGAASADCGSGGALASQSVTIPLTTLPPGVLVTDDQLRDLPGFVSRMISRRFSGATADVTVPRAASSFSPPPFRLGPPRQFRIARSGTDLLVFAEEPPVQLRLDDLFGREVEALGQGELDLLFGSASGHEVLVVDLAAAADELLPKPVFREWRARVSLDETDPRYYIERSTASIPRGHRLGELATFGSDATRIRPMILIERVVPPRVTWVLPFLAMLVLLAALAAFAARRRRLGVAWDVTVIVFALVTFRWMLTTRWKLDSPGAMPAQLDWIASGGNLFLIPPVLLAVSIVLSRYWHAVHDPKRSRTLRLLLIEGWKGEPQTSDGLKPARVWLLAAAIACAGWIAFACSTSAEALGVLWSLVSTLGVGVAAAFIATFVYAILVRVTRRSEKPHAETPAATPQAAADAARSKYDEELPWQKKKPERNLQKVRLQWPPMSWLVPALIAGAIFIAARFLLMMIGSQEELPGGIRTDVFFLPAIAAGFALLSRDRGRDEVSRLVAIPLFAAIALLGVALLVNDLGLIWVGGMAIVLCLPFVSALPRGAATVALLLFALGFLSPKFARGPFVAALRAWEGTTTIGGGPNAISFEDRLQVRRDRDHYRMLDTVQSDLVEQLPSQLAREVVLDRERVRYQATSGAWREGLRGSGGGGSLWFGAGYLASKPIVGHATFRDAARSDYAYPLYVRSEFGLVGLLGLILAYAAFFLVAPLRGSQPGGATRMGMWALALGAGTALFMIGGTAGLYPFSGKWPLLLSIGSSSDLALGLALALLGSMEEKG